jgi:hypothetical protein
MCRLERHVGTVFPFGTRAPLLYFARLALASCTGFSAVGGVACRRVRSSRRLYRSIGTGRCSSSALRSTSWNDVTCSSSPDTPAGLSRSNPALCASAGATIGRSGRRIWCRAAKSRKKRTRALSERRTRDIPALQAVLRKRACSRFCSNGRPRFATARLARDLVPADFRPAIPGAFFPVRVLSVFSVELGDTRGTRARPKPLNLRTRASHAAPRWVGSLAFDSHPLPPLSSELVE